MTKTRDILHCDLNNFYASCEILNNPSLKGLPVAVGGKQEDRHGVVIASNYEAKAFGVKCGTTNYQALKLCPNIVLLPTNFKLYTSISRKVRDIYLSFTDKVECISIDECYLDVTESKKLFGSAQEIAYKIKERVKKEIGITISVGVSFNKTFAKIGSDLKKPDAVTVISKENYKDIIYKLPIESMWGIGYHIKEKLYKMNIKKLGDIASLSKEFFVRKFGKIGADLWLNASGLDESSVKLYSNYEKPKSVGNSTTFYKDLTTKKEIKLGFGVIAENIIKRLYAKEIFCAKTIQVIVKDDNLKTYQKQGPIYNTLTTKNIIDTAYNLFIENFSHITKVRLLGISISNFCEEENEQLSFFGERKQVNKQKNIDKAILSINKKYNHNVIGRGNKLTDDKISSSFENKLGNE